MIFLLHVSHWKIFCPTNHRDHTHSILFWILTQNHCIETLDFISEAKNYRDSHGVYSASIDNNNIVQDPTLFRKQWKRLIATYISPGSPNGNNLPGNIRDALLGIDGVTVSPASPEQL
jgi:hypothetical protein